MVQTLDSQIASNEPDGFDAIARRLAGLFWRLEKCAEADELDSLRLTIQSTANDINRLASDIEEIADGTGSLLKALTDFLRDTSVQVGQLARDLDEPFLLFVIGQGKTGKSSLVNALAEQEIAEVDSIPKTWKVDIFQPGCDGMALIHYRDGTIRQLDVQSARALVREEEEKTERAKDEAAARFREASRSLKTLEEKEELKRACDKRFGYISPVTAIVWPCEQVGLLRSFRLVDTPGLWQERAGQPDSRLDLRDYYHKADGVLWLLSAEVSSSRGVQTALDELESARALLGGLAGNMIAVINRIDTMAPEDRERVLEDAQKHFGQYFLDIIPVSAKKAWEALNTGNTAEFTESGLPRLQSAIEWHFRRKAAKVQRTSKLNALKAQLAMMRSRIDEYQKTLSSDVEKYTSLSKSTETAFLELQDRLVANAADVFSQYRQQTAARIEAHAEEVLEYTDRNALRRFVERTVLDTYGLQTSLERLISDAVRQLRAEQEYWQLQLLFSEYRYLRVADLEFEKLSLLPVKLEVISLDDTRGMVDFAVGGIGLLLFGPIGLLVGLIAHSTGITKAIARLFQVPQVKEQLTKAMESIAQSAAQQVRQSLSSLREQCMRGIWDVRDRSFASVHCRYDRVEQLMSTCLPSVAAFDLNYVRPSLMGTLVKSLRGSKYVQRRSGR